MRTAASPAGVRLARAHGLFNVLGGAWPLLRMRSFEAVTGPKADRWLVRTVSGLMVANGAVQLRAEPSQDGVTAARRIGMGTALVVATVDVVYGGRHRISRMYLVDAVLETGWLVAWARCAASPGGDAASTGCGGGR
ncbi:hypothetical protein [Blastococcus goldschmidtiae]|uniref:Uncharacterized protein n=1 Tax=Blastococcus goldschmidtiae TaxID=3075546 RepID=A0ABU2K8C8_9ACTN|nr:hypothetical protein [Blastococcus sp. DSM 46792]MDT0276445.1 hypothetical protein [Blastococcus sp. DSM 46792]